MNSPFKLHTSASSVFYIAAFILSYTIIFRVYTVRACVRRCFFMAKQFIRQEPNEIAQLCHSRFHLLFGECYTVFEASHEVFHFYCNLLTHFLTLSLVIPNFIFFKKGKSISTLGLSTEIIHFYNLLSMLCTYTHIGVKKASCGVDLSAFVNCADGVSRTNS